MTQSLAILNDSLRELRSRSLFWITLAISVLVSLALFGMIGFDEKGWHILWFETNESAILRKGTPGAQDLLTWLFGGALLWWWLTWGAIVVALIVTSSTIPEFVTSGAIDLTLSKPIGRLKLYALKVLGAMLFVLLQVTISVLIAYLLMGLRFGMWFHSAWLAVPLVTLQFFYLFSMMSLVGLVTRSTLASLLVVLLFWGMISLVQLASNQIDGTMTEFGAMVAQSEKRIEAIRATAQARGRDLTPAEEARIKGHEAEIQSHRKTVQKFEPYRGPINRVELFVPKTADIQKIIADHVDAPTFEELFLRLQGFDPEMMARAARMQRDEFEDALGAGAAGSRAIRNVDAFKSIGSSLIFTGVVFGLSVLIFMRRDF